MWNSEKGKYECDKCHVVFENFEQVMTISIKEIVDDGASLDPVLGGVLNDKHYHLRCYQSKL